MNKEEVFNKPNSFFNDPQDVLVATNFSNEEKIKILENWKQFCEHKQESSNEGMLGHSENNLVKVNNALNELKNKQE